MTEFDITQWTDFVRGVVDPETEASMREHLASSPGRTRSMVAALRRVAAVGRSDGESPVPIGALRIAKALAGTVRGAAVPRIRRLPLATVFDCWLAPAPAGARSLGECHRQLTLEAQGYSIDLRLEPESGPPGEGFLGAPPARRVVVGQLLRRGADGAGRADVAAGDLPRGAVAAPVEARPVFRAPVFAFEGERLIAKAVTSSHGEFQLEGLPTTALDLCLLAGDDFLELPLPAEPGAATGSEENPS